MEQRDDRDGEAVAVEIPTAVADRIERIFVDCRGYEPASTQESLSVLCDLAEGRLDPAPADADGGATAAPGPTTDATTRHESPPGPTSDLVERIDEAFPARWDADPTVRRRLHAVVDRYVHNPNEYTGHDEREADAVAAVARREGVSPEDLRADLVSTLYGNAGLPDDLAGEFFGEAMRSVVDDEPDEPDDPGPAEDALLRGGSADELDADLGDDAFDVENLLGEVSQPTADCERCGDSHPVNDLETVIGSKTATIELLCAVCAADAE
ncbi:hypothetical protein [Haloarchaeobius litoreus]|uniref:Uncharacterized protein n=1 Tax=Haloarchaeobius litoreus TaxID=755306 RepID=A0ABD6DGL4_9EURY|nr:hypothetical protein [Haloarchaeobius litoreus]